MKFLIQLSDCLAHFSLLSMKDLETRSEPIIHERIAKTGFSFTVYAKLGDISVCLYLVLLGIFTKKFKRENFFDFPLGNLQLKFIDLNQFGNFRFLSFCGFSRTADKKHCHDELAKLLISIEIT